MARRTRFDSIHECLGPPEGRYFGDGRLRTRRTVSQLEIGTRTVRGTARLSYPPEWSRKGAVSTRPHLSSLDAIALMGEISETYLVHRFTLDGPQRSRCWLRRFDMRVSMPQEDLDEFAVSAVASTTPPEASDTQTCRTTFDCRIGTVRATCELVHPVGHLSADRGTYGTSTSLLGEAGERWHDFKDREQHITDVLLAPGLERVDAAVTVKAEGHDGRSDHGFGALYQPSLTMIEGVVSLAQLAQALTYALDDIDRDRTRTFWMRRLSMQRESPREPLHSPLRASLAVADTRCVVLHDDTWRTVQLTGHVGAIRTQAAVAHHLPMPVSPACKP